MKALLAFPVWSRQPAGGAFVENTAPMDWFVLATLGFLFFLLGSFAAWAWLLYRRSHRPAPHVKLLLEMDDETRKPEARATPREPHDPWERPADWWKR